MPSVPPDASVPQPSVPPTQLGLRQLLLTLVFIAVVILFIFGKLSPCTLLAGTIREQVIHDGGIAASLVPVMPESAFTRLTTLAPDAMSAAQCFRLDMTGDTGLAPQPAQTGMPSAAAMSQVGDTIASAIKDCRDKRLNDALKTHAESVQCSNARITEAYGKAGYPYMDIVGLFTAKRSDLAAQLDKDNLTETDEQQQMEDTMVKMVGMEHERLAKHP